MTITTRPYKNYVDLLSISKLLRQTYPIDPGWNSWSFALYDIWSQRKLGDQEVFQETEWQAGLRLWEDDGCELLGAAIYRDPDYVKLVTAFQDPHGLMPPMLDWTEARWQEMGLADKSLTIETNASNIMLEELLAARGYLRESGHYIYREKVLTGTPNEVVLLPPGFTVKHIETPEDLSKFHRGTELVFNFPDNCDVYQILRQAPSFWPELDLIILSPEAQIASFGSAWFDRGLNLAEFEPVGTVPEFRKLGLGAALIAEASNRLRVLGCARVSVMSWAESVPANRLYEKAGLMPVGAKNYWKFV